MRTPVRNTAVFLGRTRYFFERYPAPGVRYGVSGTLYYVGQRGYSWSSSIPADGSNALFLNFYNGEVAPQSTHYRATGLQVRCLQE